MQARQSTVFTEMLPTDSDSDEDFGEITVPLPLSKVTLRALPFVLKFMRLNFSFNVPPLLPNTIPQPLTTNCLDDIENIPRWCLKYLNEIDSEYSKVFWIFYVPF